MFNLCLTFQHTANFSNKLYARQSHSIWETFLFLSVLLFFVNLYEILCENIVKFVDVLVQLMQVTQIIFFNI